LMVPFADRLGLVEMLPGKKLFVANILAGEYEYFFGPVLPSVGLLQAFELIKFEEGVVINKPNAVSYPHLQSWSRTQRINTVYREAEEWSAMIDCNTVAKLNKIIEAGHADKIIRVAEALQEKKIAGIADDITNSSKKIRLVLIAGPSSSGKTSFAQRLSDQLQVNGVKPLPISMDNYYLNREDTPRKPDGSYDFECVEAIDLQLFNDHLKRLLNGESVKLP
jgi:uridine kinase